ncbi:MAG: hypothetical protein AAGG99_05625 [Pseudomonadota bacterium]
MSIDEALANVVVMVAVAVVYLGFCNAYDLFAAKRDETGVSSWRMAWLLIFGAFTWVTINITAKGGDAWTTFDQIIQRHAG